MLIVLAALRSAARCASATAAAWISRSTTRACAAARRFASGTRPRERETRRGMLCASSAHALAPAAAGAWRGPAACGRGGAPRRACGTASRRGPQFPIAAEAQPLPSSDAPRGVARPRLPPLRHAAVPPAQPLPSLQLPRALPQRANALPLGMPLGPPCRRLSAGLRPGPAARGGRPRLRAPPPGAAPRQLRLLRGAWSERRGGRRERRPARAAPPARRAGAARLLRARPRGEARPARGRKRCSACCASCWRCSRCGRAQATRRRRAAAARTARTPAASQDACVVERARWMRTDG